MTDGALECSGRWSARHLRWASYFLLEKDRHASACCFRALFNAGSGGSLVLKAPIGSVTFFYLSSKSPSTEFTQVGFHCFQPRTLTMTRTANPCTSERQQTPLGSVPVISGASAAPGEPAAKAARRRPARHPRDLVKTPMTTT